MSSCDVWQIRLVLEICARCTERAKIASEIEITSSKTYEAGYLYIFPMI